MYIRFTFSCFKFLIRGNLKSFRTEGLQIVFVLVVVVAVVVVWGFFMRSGYLCWRAGLQCLEKYFEQKEENK